MNSPIAGLRGKGDATDAATIGLNGQRVRTFADHALVGEPVPMPESDCHPIQKGTGLAMIRTSMDCAEPNMPGIAMSEIVRFSRAPVKLGWPV